MSDAIQNSPGKPQSTLEPMKSTLGDYRNISPTSKNQQTLIQQNCKNKPNLDSFIIGELLNQAIELMNVNSQTFALAVEGEYFDSKVSEPLLPPQFGDFLPQQPQQQPQYICNCQQVHPKLVEFIIFKLVRLVNELIIIKQQLEIQWQKIKLV